MDRGVSKPLEGLPNRHRSTRCPRRARSRKFQQGPKRDERTIEKSEICHSVIVTLAQNSDPLRCVKLTSGNRRMPGSAAAAAEETPVPRERYEKGRKDKPARGGGSKPQTGSGERDVSPSATSTGSWIKIKGGRRTISQWMEIDKADETLDWKRALPADKRDELYLGAPCWGNHDTTHPLARHANG